jgi:hypothetical protein
MQYRSSPAGARFHRAHVGRDFPQPCGQFLLSGEEPSDSRHANVSITRLIAGCLQRRLPIIHLSGQHEGIG